MRCFGLCISCRDCTRQFWTIGRKAYLIAGVFLAAIAVIVLVVVVLVFGTSKLRNMGGDLGAAVRNFKQAMKEGEADASSKSDEPPKQ